MSKPAIRTDGAFGALYASTDNIRAVIAEYRRLTGCGYRQAWADWFAWANNKEG